MPGGAAEDVPVCLVLGIASVTAIDKKKNPYKCFSSQGQGHQDEHEHNLYIYIYDAIMPSLNVIA